MSTTQAATAGAAADTPAGPSAVTTPYPFTSLSDSIDKLDGSMATGKSNYIAWKFRILRILKEKGLARAFQDGS